MTDGTGRGEQLVLRYDRELRHELLRLGSRKDGEAAEALGAGLLEQLERSAGIVGENGGGPGTQGCGNRALGPGLDLERSERKTRSTLGEGTRSRRKALLLCEDTLERPETLAREACLLGEAVSLGRGAPGRDSGVEGFALELRPAVRLARRHGLERRKLPCEPVAEGGGGLAAELETLAPTLQTVEGGDGSLAATRSVRELVLRARAVGEEPFEPRLGAAPGERCGVAPNLDLAAPVSCVGHVELRNSRAQGGDLDGELLGPLGGRRLERERSQSLPYLLLDVSRALDLQRDARELQLGTMPSALELPEPGGLLDERSPVLRLRGEHLLDLALADDRVHRRPEPDVGKELDEVGPPDRGLVDEVLALAAADEPARDRDLAEVELRPVPVLVVEHELDLAVLGGFPVAAAGEEDVVGLLCAELGRGQRARRPDDRVRDVRLPGAVRADDDRNPLLEIDLERTGEGFEAADLDRLQVHRTRILPSATDGTRTSSALKPRMHR